MIPFDPMIDDGVQNRAVLIETAHPNPYPAGRKSHKNKLMDSSGIYVVDIERILGSP